MFSLREIIRKDDLDLYIIQMIGLALTGVAQLVGLCAAEQKVASLIPSQGTCLGCGFGPWLGHIQGADNQSFSLTLIFLFLSSSLPCPLSKK